MTSYESLVGKATAYSRLSLLAGRTRMTYEDLATAFHASGMCQVIPRDICERARLVAVKDDGLIIASTFANTVAINRAFLDLYEEAPQVRRIA
jgi:hypothetical protein